MSPVAPRSSPTPFSFIWQSQLWQRHGEALRYLVVGGLNTVVGYATFAAFNFWLTGRLPYPYMFANLFANVVAITFAFAGYKFFVFKTKGNWVREYLRTYVVYGSSTLVGLAILPALVYLLGRIMQTAAAVPYVAQALCTCIVVAASFVGHKRFTFRR